MGKEDRSTRQPTALAPNQIIETKTSVFRPDAIVSALRRRRRLFWSVLACAMAVALAANLLLPKRYTAAAEVLLAAGGGAGASAVGGGNRIGDEMRILRSRKMAEAVGASLRLAPGALEYPTLLSRLTGGGASAAVARRRMVDRLAGRLVVTPMEDTYALTIAYTAPSPDVAAAVANAYAAQHVAGRLAGMEAAVSPLDRPFARIISQAEPPLAASSPGPFAAIALGALLGALLGAIVVVLVERRSAGITSGRDISERFSLPHLGSVPTLASVLPAARSPLAAMVEAQASGFAEAFRGLMMSIRLAGGRGTQLIAISSALPNEGKTTIAACLARSIALGGEGIVLIDCDARRRDATTLFGLADVRAGLVEVLRYEVTLDEVLVRDAASGAWILPLAETQQEVAELLAGPAMVALLEDLKRRFKRVIVDTPPILAISGTRAIAAIMDVLVVVVRWRATPDHAVRAALKLLPEEHVRVGGIVLSRVDITAQTRVGFGDPTYYYDQYSKYYSS